MVVNDNAGNLTPRGAHSSFASWLAPTKKKQTAPPVLRDTPRYKLDALFTSQLV